MVLSFVPLVALLSMQASTPPAPAVGPAAPAAGARDERAARAADLYRRAQFVGASLEFEALHRDYPGEPRFLFNAGTTRFAAQHYADAIVHFNAYIARADVAAADRKEAQAQLDEARNRVASVSLSADADPDARDEVTFVVRRLVRGVPDRRSALTFTAPPIAGVATQVVLLDPGGWSLETRAGGVTVPARSFTVEGLAPQRMHVPRVAAAPIVPVSPTPQNSITPTTPTPPPTDAPTTTRPRPLVVGLLVGGGIVSGTGVALLGTGAVRRAGLADCDGNLEDCKVPLGKAVWLRDAGAGTLGGGVGVLAGGLVWLVRDADLRRKLWIGGAVVGGLAAVGGAAGAVATTRAYRDAHFAPIDAWAPYYSGPGDAPLKATSAAVLGLGVGLLTSSVASLVIQKLRPGTGLRALRIDGAASPRLTGLVVSGRF